MGRDPTTGKNRKFGHNREKEVEELTEEQLLDAMAIRDQERENRPVREEDSDEEEDESQQ